jgi:four helix bundle protein
VREGLDHLEDRTKQFAIEVVWICARLQDVRGLRQTAWQLADSSGSVASNHRAMRRARSNKEFAAKLQTVNEEADESVLWLEIARAVLNRLAAIPGASPAQLPVTSKELDDALREASELRAIFASARRTFRERRSGT